MSEVKRDFNKAAASWDMEPRRLKMAEDVARAIAGEVPLTPEMDALDFGCGTGLLSFNLQPRVRSVTGVDSSRGMLEVFMAKAESQGLANVKARFVDMENGDKLEGSYHLVASSMTFHHIKDTRALLEQLYSVTAPGGHLCVADLDPDNGRFHEDGTGVFHNGFDRAEMCRTFAKAGFGDIRSRTAAEMVKPAPGGGIRSFTIFLVTGMKN